MMARKAVFVAFLLATTTGVANATTIDFSSLASGTAVTTQFPGLTVSLIGGADSGSAVIGPVFGGPLALGNSSTNSYPTAFTLNFAFSNPVSGVSFTFNNFGTENGSNFVASGSSGIISSGLIDAINDYSVVTVSGSGITNLAINNAESIEWLFGVGQLSFTGAVPEPSSWAMMIAGFGLVGATLRRRRIADAIA